MHTYIFSYRYGIYFGPSLHKWNIFSSIKNESAYIYMYLYIKLSVTSSDLTLISLIPVGLSGIICREYHRISMDFNFLFTFDIYGENHYPP